MLLMKHIYRLKGVTTSITLALSVDLGGAQAASYCHIEYSLTVAPALTTKYPLQAYKQKASSHGFF